MTKGLLAFNVTHQPLIVMPISGPSSYLPTIDLFLAHWQDADTANGSPIALPDGSTRGTLSGLRESLMDSQSTVESKINDVEIGNATLLQQKEAMLAHLGDFNRRVRGLLPSTPFASALPEIPNVGNAMGRFTKPLNDMASLWSKINASLDPGEPFLLTDDYTAANFDSALFTLNQAYMTDADNEQELKLARENRNVLQEQIYPMLVSYRRVIEALFAPDSAIVESLPALSPAPGHTPEPVIAAGEWDADASAAHITYSASEELTLDHYQLRRSPVSPYDTDDEVVIGTNQPEDAREFFTTAGLADPEDTALFRVYVVLTTENAKGSDTVSITRP